MRSFVVRDTRALASLFSTTLLTLESTDLLQHRQAPGGSTGVAAKSAAVAIVARDTTSGAGGTLDLVQSIFQEGQRVLAVSVVFSVVPLRRHRVAEVTKIQLGVRGGRSLKLRLSG